MLFYSFVDAQLACSDFEFIEAQNCTEQLASFQVF